MSVDHVTLEALIQDPEQDVLRLNQGRLNTDRLGDAASTTAWVPLTADAQNIRVRRGTRRAGLSLSAQVGTLTATFIDPPELGLRPNTPIRLSAAGAPLFTGTVLDIRETWKRHGPSNVLRRLVTLTAADAVQQLVNTPRHGVSLPHEYKWEDFEFYPDRIHRYLAPTRLPYVTAATTERAYAGGRHSLSIRVGSWTPDHTITGGPSGPAIFTTYLLPGYEYDSPAGEGLIFSHRDWPAGSYVHGGMWVRVTAGPNGPPPSHIGVHMLGEVPEPVPVTLGRWQYIEGGAPMPYDYPADDTGSIGVAFVITDHTEAAGPAEGATRIEWTGLALSDGPFAGDKPLQSVVYESTLANHLDLAAASVGTAWWVGEDGVIQAPAQLPTSTRPELLTDDPSHLDPFWNDASYVGIDFAFDTAGLVNSVQLDNRGRTRDPDTGEPRADDIELGPWEDVTSRATYGTRAASVDTMLLNTTAVPLDQVPAARARDYLTAATRAAPAPSRVRIHNDDRHVFRPRLMDRISVEFRQTIYRLRVIAIEHEITPTAWHSTYDLMED